MTKEELLAEEYICNGKCQDDITRNYVHCKTCTRLKDFLAGYKVGKTDLERENVELKELLEACKQERIEALYRNEQYIKENAELKGRNAELRGMYVHSAREAGTYKQFLEAKEKENAELKEKYAKNITDCDICDTYCNSQLTKAKEIIKGLKAHLDLSDCVNNDYRLQLLKQAEQFLSEVEK